MFCRMMSDVCHSRQQLIQNFLSTTSVIGNEKLFCHSRQTVSLTLHPAIPILESGTRENKSPYVSWTFTSSRSSGTRTVHCRLEGHAREITGPSVVHDSDRPMLAVLGHAERLGWTMCVAGRGVLGWTGKMTLTHQWSCRV